MEGTVDLLIGIFRGCITFLLILPHKDQESFLIVLHILDLCLGNFNLFISEVLTEVL